jgi:hypothetical protein
MRQALSCVVLLLLAPAVSHAQKSEFRLGGLFLGMRLNAIGGTPPTGLSSTVSGVEGMAQGDGVGLYGRYLNGSFSSSAGAAAGQVRSMEVRLIIGPPVFSLQAGYVRRDRTSPLSSQTDNLLLTGGRSSVRFGPSGLTLNLSLGAYVRSDSAPEPGSSSSGTKVGVVGWEAMSAVVYQAPRGIPLYFQLGYRFERIRSEEGYPPVRKEELSSIVFGVGLRHLAFRKPAEPPKP